MIRTSTCGGCVFVSQRLGTFDLMRRYEARVFKDVAAAVTSFGANAGTYLASNPLVPYNHYEQVWGKKATN